MLQEKLPLGWSGMVSGRKIVKPELNYLQESVLAENAKAAEGDPLPVVLVESDYEPKWATVTFGVR